jgi:hypothetical protein
MLARDKLVIEMNAETMAPLSEQLKKYYMIRASTPRVSDQLGEVPDADRTRPRAPTQPASRLAMSAISWRRRAGAAAFIADRAVALFDVAVDAMLSHDEACPT